MIGLGAQAKAPPSRDGGPCPFLLSMLSNQREGAGEMAHVKYDSAIDDGLETLVAKS